MLPLIHPTEFLVVMFVPSSITLLYTRGKIKGPIHRATNCECKTINVPMNFSFSSIRKDKVILTRLGIGHTRLTHGHVLCGKQASVSTVLDTALTVSHNLVEWPCYNNDCVTFIPYGTLCRSLRTTSVACLTR
jgi:hypothetical protein